MSPKHHIAVSAVVSGILFAIFRSWPLTISSFVSGILIDLDHIVDYIIEYGYRFDIKKFFNFFYGEKYSKLTLILHGWEWLFVLLAASWLTAWNHLVVGMLIGFGHHLLLDKLYNISTILSYSLLWRWKNRFDTRVITLKNRRKGKG
jgi:hypothetical protein